jgi:hypothetical protein
MASSKYGKYSEGTECVSPIAFIKVISFMPDFIESFEKLFSISSVVNGEKFMVSGARPPSVSKKRSLQPKTQKNSAKNDRRFYIS